MDLPAKNHATSHRSSEQWPVFIVRFQAVPKFRRRLSLVGGSSLGVLRLAGVGLFQPRLQLGSKLLRFLRHLDRDIAGFADVVLQVIQFNRVIVVILDQFVVA